MRKRNVFATIIAFAATCGALIVSSGTPMYAKAQPQSDTGSTSSSCKLATVKGPYGVLSSGTYLGVGPLTAVGRVVVDGAGKFTYDYTENINGTVKSGTVDGTYTVSRDCLATVTYSNGAQFTGVIVSGGDEIDLISTIPSYVVSTAVLKRIEICAKH